MVSSVGSYKNRGFLYVDSEDKVDAQADLSLRWAYSHFVSFVMLRLNFA